jgi:hypothetical protein
MTFAQFGGIPRRESSTSVVTVAITTDPVIHHAEPLLVCGNLHFSLAISPFFTARVSQFIVSPFFPAFIETHRFQSRFVPETRHLSISLLAFSNLTWCWDARRFRLQSIDVLMTPQRFEQ